MVEEVRAGRGADLLDSLGMDDLQLVLDGLQKEGENGFRLRQGPCKEECPGGSADCARPGSSPRARVGSLARFGRYPTSSFRGNMLLSFALEDESARNPFLHL